MIHKTLISIAVVALMTAGLLWSSDSADEGAGLPLVELAQEETPPEAEPGVWDLPMGDFAVALVIAALIGVVGGFVYAGIMGPRRRDERGPDEGGGDREE